MCPGRRPATGWIANRTFDAAARAAARELLHRVLRLRDRHAVAGDDDDALRAASSARPPRRRWSRCTVAGRRRRRRRPWRRLGAEAAEHDVPDRPVHRAAHDVAQDRAASADQRAGDDQQVVRQHEARRRRRPARVAVEQRHHDRHVAAADRHDQVDAEQQRDARHRQQRRHAGVACPAASGHASERQTTSPATTHAVSATR